MTKTSKAKIAKRKIAKTKSVKAKIVRSKPKKANPGPAKSSAKQPSRGRLSPEVKLAEVKRRLLEISDLGFADAVLEWDQATYMPPGGAQARGRQAAMLSKIAHEKSVDPELGRLLDDVAPYADGLPYES